MIDERIGLNFFVQCDTQIARQEGLVALLSQAGCFSIFVGVESFNRSTLLAARKGQNRPELYHDIVRLCRNYGISSHFSNIIGFSDDTEREILHHVETLRDLGPSCASFYILCPIPGTEQYDDFLNKGLIRSKNLDRFDTTCLTWEHPNLSPEQLLSLLYRAYGRFYSVGHVLRNAYQLTKSDGKYTYNLLNSFASLLFNRYSVWRSTHPMSGGAKRVAIDAADEFLSLRRKVFGFELVPLPQSLR